jgi:hypothetical protein
MNWRKWLMNKELEVISHTKSEAFKMPEPIALLNVYHPNVKRDEAVELLRNCIEGTFLLRPASISNSLAVSYVVNHEVRHCTFQIEMDGRVKYQGKVS